MKSQSHCEIFLSKIGKLAVEDCSARRKSISEEAPEFHALSFFHSKEETVSKIIAYLLNPYGQHGQGTHFLRKFLRALGISCENLQSPVVVPEFVLPSGRRIDILIRFSAHNADHVIAIESKSKGAADQPKQIEDYLSYLRSAYPPETRKHLFYLKGGGPPSKKSIGAGQWRRAELEHICCAMKFSSVVSDWLSQSINERTAPKIKMFVKDFMHFIGADKEHHVGNNGEVHKLVMGILEQAISTPDGGQADLEAVLAIYDQHDRIWPKAVEVCMKNVRRVLQKRFPDWEIQPKPDFENGEYYFELKLWKKCWEEAAPNKGLNLAVVLASEDMLRTEEHQEGYRGPIYFEMYIKKAADFSSRGQTEFNANYLMIIGPGKKVTRSILVNGIEDARSADAIRFLLSSQGTTDIANQIAKFVMDHEKAMDACFA